MLNVKIHRFGQSSQFTILKDKILLMQGSEYVAQGTLQDWIQLFLTLRQLTPQSSFIQITQTLVLHSLKNAQIVQIADSTTTYPQALQLQIGDVSHLKSKLLELYQGCCEPLIYNPVAEIQHQPDSVLDTLQTLTQVHLSSEQLAIAKTCLASFPNEIEPTVQDLYSLWIEHPQLAQFSETLLFYF